MKKQKILLIDDSSFMRNILKKILNKAGYYNIIEASNGKEGIKQYKNNHPDIITMDVTMPEMDGITATKEILKIDKTANIIICSAMGQKSFIYEAIEAGAKDYIIKPFESEQIINIINRFSERM